MQSPKVHMLILMENDLPKAMEFYQQLGIEPIFHVPEKWAEFNINGVKLGLAPTEQALPERHTGIVLSVDNIEEYINSLKELNIVIYKEPVEALHGIMASIKDPGNNIIDLYQPTPEKVEEALKKAEHDAEGME